MADMSVRDLIIIGAGPSGLSAAIAAKQRGLDYQVIEQGTLVNSIYRFPPQMVFFTTPELLEIGGLPFVSPYEKPTRTEALKYYRRVVDAYDLAIAFDEKVLSVASETEEARQAGEPSLFTVETRSARGVRRPRMARHVIFASGYYDRPVMLNIPGEDLPHVSHYYADPHPYYRQRVVVVGGGNSAAEAALELYRAGAHVTLVHRWPELKSTIKYWVRPDIENRIKEGAIAARFNSCLCEIRPTTVVVSGIRGDGESGRRESIVEVLSHPQGTEAQDGLQTSPEADAIHAAGNGPSARNEHRRSAGGGKEELPADAVFLLVGYRADTQLMVDAGVELTAREGPSYHADTFETNVPGLFVAGGALAGIDTGTVFIENGRFHGEKIVETIARRMGGTAL
jgi:thioredoxin reductase (NADPH)